jgi:hypothetical protein
MVVLNKNVPIAQDATKVGKSYCWQVALQQSLLPLQIYSGSLSSIFELITNYFWHHCLKKSSGQALTQRRPTVCSPMNKP